MTRDELVAYCLAKPGAWPDGPWGDDLVAKVGDKIFAFLGARSPGVGVKCGSGRDEADEWLTRYPGDATALAYIGRFGWNLLHCDGSIPGEDLREAVDASYEAVVRKLPRRDRPPPADQRAAGQ